MDLLIKVMTGLTNFASHLFTSAFKLFGATFTKLAMSSASGLDLVAIRSELEKFEGGSVDLELEDESGIAVMTLNNPKRLNSLTGKMMVDMANHITTLEAWPAGKGVILVGAEGNFCSGGDLTFVRKALHYGEEMAAFQHDTLTRLLNLPLISVALLQGHTLGGGAELSTACDFRVISSSGRVGFVQLKMGLTSGWGGTTRLVRLLGRQKALALLSSSRILSGEEALSEGLVDHVLSYALPKEEEFSECKKWFQSNFCKHNAELIRGVKDSIVHCDVSGDLVDSLAKERKVFSKFWGGPIQKAALASNIKHK